MSAIAGGAIDDERRSKIDDPACHLTTTAIEEATNNAGAVLESIPSDRIGFILSTTKANIEALERFDAGVPCSNAARRHLRPDLLADDLAEAHGTRGPVRCVSIACVSGLVAIQLGAKMIQRGDADAVIVAGVDHLSAFVTAGFSSLKAIDPEGCRPFDQNRRGLSPGEAGAAVVLVAADAAPPGSIGISGWGTSNDANHLTGPSRDGSGLALAIRAALRSSQLEPGNIDYINVHGTGTPFNDAMEGLALKGVFGDACPPFSGSKGIIGHTLGAAGVIETIACGLAMKNSFTPGTPRLTSAADELPTSLVREPRDATPLRHVLKINVGFGGINSAIVLRHE